jgi:hypothetical protein
MTTTAVLTDVRILEEMITVLTKEGVDTGSQNSIGASNLAKGGEIRLCLFRSCVVLQNK